MPVSGSTVCSTPRCALPSTRCAVTQPSRWSSPPRVSTHCTAGSCCMAAGLGLGLTLGMSTFASSCDPAYVQARGWQTAVALLRGEPSPGPAEYASARRFLLGLPHAPPLDEKGKPIMGRKHAQRLGRHVYARVLAVFNEAEAGRTAASALRFHFPRSAAALRHDSRRAAARAAPRPAPQALPPAFTRPLLTAGDVAAALQHYGPYLPRFHRAGSPWTWAALGTLADRRHHEALKLCRTCLLKLRLHCLRAGPARQGERGGGGDAVAVGTGTDGGDDRDARRGR